MNGMIERSLVLQSKRKILLHLESSRSRVTPLVAFRPWSKARRACPVCFPTPLGARQARPTHPSIFVVSAGTHSDDDVAASILHTKIVHDQSQCAERFCIFTLARQVSFGACNEPVNRGLTNICLQAPSSVTVRSQSHLPNLKFRPHLRGRIQLNTGALRSR